MCLCESKPIEARVIQILPETNGPRLWGKYRVTKELVGYALTIAALVVMVAGLIIGIPTGGAGLLVGCGIAGMLLALAGIVLSETEKLKNYNKIKQIAENLLYHYTE